MSLDEPGAALLRAAEISRRLVAVADGGDVELTASLDAERLQLLKSFRLGRKQIDAADRVLLQEISQLNNKAIGCMEHHRRSKEREMDMALVGRRAVAAYGTTRQRR
jgi:molybdenum-dependent DNA-binding transcriptional regulator ModE